MGQLSILQSPVMLFTLSLLTFIAVNITWVFFRADDLGTSLQIIRSMFGFAPDNAATPLPTLYIIEVLVVMSLLVSSHWYMQHSNLEDVVAKIPAWEVTTLLILMTFTIVTTQRTDNAFIYFQF
jgi:alginate O-acetyltransferase complex protein AlgI